MKSFYTLSILFLVLSSYAPCSGQSTWQLETNHPGLAAERAFSFEIDNVLYISGGRSDSLATIWAVWAYDLADKTWTRKNDFTGTPRRNAFAFAINGMGYMGGGFTGTETISDFWQYDPIADVWTQLSDFPGGARSHALAFADDEKGYVSAGADDANNIYYNDLWEFEPILEVWLPYGGFPGDGRWRAYGWLADNMIYVGGGSRVLGNGYQDFYAYDLNDHLWSTKEPCPTTKTTGGLGFGIKNHGFFLEGADLINNALGEYGRKVFRYDTDSDNWTEDLPFIADGRVLGIQTVVDDKVYLGMGRSYLTETYYDDIYTFHPDLPSSTKSIEKSQVSIYPNPVTTTLFLNNEFSGNDEHVISIRDAGGQLQMKTKVAQLSTPLRVDVSDFRPGLYYIESRSGERVDVQKFVKI